MIFGRNLIYVVFVTLLTTTLVCSHGVRALAEELAALPASAEDTTPLATGDRAPAFTVRTVDGEPFVFEPDNLVKPAILISFRGGWCPFCNMHLSELRTVIPEIAANGIDVFFLSNDRPEQLYASLKKETKEDIAGLDYVILSDADLSAARALRTAFKVDSGLTDLTVSKSVSSCFSSLVTT